MVIFTIGKQDGTVGWGSGFACFPNRRATLTCAHNFTGAVPETVIARHVSTDMRCAVPNVAFSKNLDCAIAILQRPLVAEPLPWAISLSEGEPIAIPEYVVGSSEDRFEVAWKGTLADTHLTGCATDIIIKSAIWIGSRDRARDVRLFEIPGIHPGLSGSPMINQEGALVGQVADSLDAPSSLTVNSHLLEELKADAESMYARARTKGYV